MRVLISIGSLLGGFLFWAQSAVAEDVALVLGDLGQVEYLQNDSETRARDFSRPLRKAGFRVVQPRNRSSGNMRLTAQGVETAIANGQVDRLVIIVMGPIASSGDATWILSNGGTAATSLNIGVSALPLKGLSDMAANAKGRAVILIAPGRELDTLGTGLTPGLDDFARVDGVTYVTGPADQLVGVLENGLLDPEKSLTDVAQAAPKVLTFSGFMSDRVGLMGTVEPSEAKDAEERGFWAAVQQVDTADAYEAYTRAYPDGPHVKAAQDRIAYLNAAPERLAQETEAALNLTREARRAIQRDLALLGFDPRGIDGLFGAGSRAAIVAWQRDQGYEETAYLNGNQLLRLRDQARLRAQELEAQALREQAEKDRLDQAYWRDTGRNGDEAGLRAYLERYPDGAFSEIARARLAEIEEARLSETERAERDAWDATREADDAQSYQAFLRDFPQSGFAAAAQARLRELTEDARNAEAVAQAKAEERQVAGVKVARLLVERRLAQVGAKPGKVDGDFTEKTRQAIRRYQRHRNLPVTGYVSRQTMVRLMAGG